eukprot:TRINITY_DN20469_c0_g1_i1.p2 TRINITY_DN20469_c0_g1~~TRINITY_DN20469_c0_g1_i1.p2  ORF type:complete len:101 (+),score=26.93 TRINITY_DN20469_c0_g1_i1:36-305(+)
MAELIILKMKHQKTVVFQEVNQTDKVGVAVARASTATGQATDAIKLATLAGVDLDPNQTFKEQGVLDDTTVAILFKKGAAWEDVKAATA